MGGCGVEVFLWEDVELKSFYGGCGAEVFLWEDVELKSFYGRIWS